MMGSPRPNPATDCIADEVVDEAVGLVAGWVTSAPTSARGRAAAARRLADLIEDPDGVEFTMRFVDRVIRPEDARAAARQLHALVKEQALPGFLSTLDRLMLSTGATLAPRVPRLVMPLARRRARRLVGHLIADADTARLQRHLRESRSESFDINVNPLGEAVLGEDEAAARLSAAADLLGHDDVDYVSVKASSIVSQLNLWAFDESVVQIVARLRILYDRALESSPPKFVNLDMEEYRDLELTIEAFTRLLSEPRYLEMPAGIVLQAYLPESFPALQRLAAWAAERHEHGGGRIKIRLVKGANLAMEQVEAALRGWEQAPYASKADTDANYKRCLDWVLTPERTLGLEVGVASHNLFDVAWAHLLSLRRGVGDRVQFEMLQGMAPDQARLVRDQVDGLLLYTPVVRRRDFDAAIAYLFRRLEENAADENFLRHLFSLRPGTDEFASEETKFRTAVTRRHQVGRQPRRNQDRTIEPKATPSDAAFANEPDTDPALPANRAWARATVHRAFDPVQALKVVDAAGIDGRVGRAAAAADDWLTRTATERRKILHRAADELCRRRGDLVNAMVHEASKTISEADPEISEAIDFARWYGDRALDLEQVGGASFQPLGVVAVIPPWNFPVAIPAGGVFASLAAGNSVVFKPSKETPRCAEIIAEACWAAGVPDHTLQFVYTTDREVGRHLVTHPQIGAVILTGSWETAQRFLGWRPDLALFAETSGKNAMIVSPHADLDLAAGDLVHSAFSHSGQKCSAASLGILIGDVYDSERFRRQLVDATRSLVMGTTAELKTMFGPVIRPPTGALNRGLTMLDNDETWLLEPEVLDNNQALWSPGIRLGVKSGSWYHQTECFGPVLGLMHARDLDHAIEMQNASAYGLTGGIHSLEPAEVDTWLERVEVGNAYVNRHTTGAIVQRQPFGGWKRSVIGPGFKAGGPNYLHQLGHWTNDDLPTDGAPLSPRIEQLQARLSTGLSPEDRAYLDAAAKSDQYWWRREFSVEHDPAAIRYEANRFRYRPRPHIVIRVEADATDRHIARVLLAAERAGVTNSLSTTEPRAILDAAGAPTPTVESSEQFAHRLSELSGHRVRVVGTLDPSVQQAAHDAEVDIASAPVLANGRLELLWYLREQAISQTKHRFGNLID